jgi:DNA gyrase subunit A
MQRPDLSNLDPVIRQYIDFLENRITELDSRKRIKSTEYPANNDKLETILQAEPSTTINIVSASKNGLAKRTYRHLFTPQHRGGMGVFDLDVNQPDHPAVISSINENQNLLIFTSHARVFRLNLSKFVDSPVRSKGQPLIDPYLIEENETLAAILPEKAEGNIAMLSNRGRVRSLRHHLFGEHMRPGTPMFNHKEFGELVSATWTTGNSDLFTVTRRGMAIRFPEKIISPQGDWGIKLADGDQAVSIAAVYADSGVFICSQDGKGTIRLMSGFAPNKSSGGSGKTAIKSDAVAGAVTIDQQTNIFLLTRLGKIIRFNSEEIPATEGVVQGVNVMSLRGDDIVAVAQSGLSVS